MAKPRTFAGVAGVYSSVSEVASHPPDPEIFAAELWNRHCEIGHPWEARIIFREAIQAKLGRQFEQASTPRQALKT